MIMRTSEGVADMFGWCHGQAGWAGWTAMTVSMVMLGGSAVLAGLMIWRGSWARAREDLRADDPLTLLEARFARGEIDEQEYVERRDTLAHPAH